MSLRSNKPNNVRRGDENCPSARSLGLSFLGQLSERAAISRPGDEPRAGGQSMAQALHMGRLVVNRHRRGFTLVEMMIVVVIVGVLATLAVVGYRKLVNSSHVSEATNMVQNIRLAQEAYHSETQQYANISKNFPAGASPTTGLYPAHPKNAIQTPSGAPSAPLCGSNADWKMMPLHGDAP